MERVGFNGRSEEWFFSFLFNNDIWVNLKKHMYPGLKTKNFDSYDDGDSAIYHSYYTLLLSKNFNYTQESIERVFEIKVIAFESDLPHPNTTEAQYFDIFNFLSNKGIKPNRRTLNLACLFGYSKIVKYYYIGDTKLISLAAVSGNLELFKWLYYEKEEKDIYDAACNAASNNHLNIIQFIHQETLYELTLHIMNNAAKHTAVDVFKYLLSIGIEPTEYTRDEAIKAGNLDILKLINYRGGYNVAILLIAACEGYIEVLQYCFEQQDLTCYVDMFLLFIETKDYPELKAWLISMK